AAVRMRDGDDGPGRRSAGEAAGTSGRKAADRMTLCDLSPFYCANGGGIRTFHHARLDWSRAQTRHRYILIAPGPRFAIDRLSPHAWVARVYGALLSRDADRYRFLLDVPAVRSLVEQVRPDILEAHDPFISMPLAWWFR